MQFSKIEFLGTGFIVENVSCCMSLASIKLFSINACCKFGFIFFNCIFYISQSFTEQKRITEIY